MSVGMPSNIPRSGGIMWVTVSVGVRLARTLLEMSVKSKTIKMCFYRRTPIVFGFLKLKTNPTNFHRP